MFLVKFPNFGKSFSNFFSQGTQRFTCKFSDLRLYFLPLNTLNIIIIKIIIILNTIIFSWNVTIKKNALRAIKYKFTKTKKYNMTFWKEKSMFFSLHSWFQMLWLDFEKDWSFYIAYCHVFGKNICMFLNFLKVFLALIIAYNVSWILNSYVCFYSIKSIYSI